MGTQQKKKKRTDDNRALTAEIKRTQDLDVNKLALEPSFELGYSPIGVGTISFVNVSSQLGPAQGGSGGGPPNQPAQVTGLNVTPHAGSNTQLDLTWNAITTSDFNFYTVYRGNVSGFVADSSNDISTPTTNSYNNTGLSTGTKYYYRVSTTNDASIEGPLSAEANATTNSPTATLSLDLQLNNNYTDSTGLNTIFNRIAAGNTAFATTGVFGSHYAQVNVPSIPVATTADHIGATDNVNIQLDFTNGFSYSLWIKPTDISAAAQSSERIILTKGIENADNVNIGIDSNGKLFAYVERLSTGQIYGKRDSAVISTSAFTHVVVTFAPSTNTLLLYKNKVEITTVLGAGTLINTILGGYNNLVLGHDSNNQGLTAYEGAIDEVKYYRIVLSQTQVNNLYNTNNANTSDTTPPGQVTGLSASVISGTQINLTWTASTASDLDHYDVHRSTTSGFTPSSSNRIQQPTTNSYNDTGLTASTTYYYKVAAVDESTNIGTYSTQVTAATTGATALTPNALLHFDNNYTVVGPASTLTWNITNPQGFTTGSKFGTHAVNLNTGSSPPSTYIACIEGANSIIAMNTTVGFSISLWIYPTDISALDERRIIVEHYFDANNKWTLQLSSGGTVYFFVKKGGTDYKTQKGGFVINTWQHIGAVFDAATNTITLYKNGSSGGASTQATQYPTVNNSSLTFSFRYNESLDHYYEGRIDEFQYFNGVVLSSAQITSLMNTNSTT